MPAPPFRKGKVDDLAFGAAQFLSELVKECREALPTCLSCAYFMEASSYCNRYAGNPPPRIIVYACESYTDTDTVPY